jgi:hypothetical protein
VILIFKKLHILRDFFCHATSLLASGGGRARAFTQECNTTPFIHQTVYCTHTNNMRPPHPFIKVIGIRRIDWKRSIYSWLSFATWTVVKMLWQCSVLLLASTCLWGLCSAVFIGTRTCHPQRLTNSHLKTLYSILSNEVLEHKVSVCSPFKFHFN